MPINTIRKLKDVKLIEKKSLNSASRNILVVGVFHGEEPQGKYMIERYLEEKDFSGIKNSLYFIPCLNPYGMQRKTRGNINGVDLNRNYPTKNWALSQKDEFFSGPEPASEYETKFMIEVLKKVRPNVILTLHAPLKCVNFDGPAKALAIKIAGICGYPLQENIGYPTPGSFGTYCGLELHIPIITLEFDDNESNKTLYKKTVQVIDYLSNLSPTDSY